jgi:hypothetical protein
MLLIREHDAGYGSHTLSLSPRLNMAIAIQGMAVQGFVARLGDLCPQTLGRGTYGQLYWYRDINIDYGSLNAFSAVLIHIHVAMGCSTIYRLV